MIDPLSRTLQIRMRGEREREREPSLSLSSATGSEFSAVKEREKERGRKGSLSPLSPFFTSAIACSSFYTMSTRRGTTLGVVWLVREKKQDYWNSISRRKKGQIAIKAHLYKILESFALSPACSPKAHLNNPCFVFCRIRNFPTVGSETEKGEGGERRRPRVRTHALRTSKAPTSLWETIIDSPFLSGPGRKNASLSRPENYCANILPFLPFLLPPSSLSLPWSPYRLLRRDAKRLFLFSPRA